MIELRAMAAADLDCVFANELRSYRYPWTRGNFEDCLRARNACRVACLDGRIVGHGILASAAGESHLLNVCVCRDHQGRGFGRVLVEHMLDQAVVAGSEMVFLEVRPSNRVALQLYASLGFNEIGIRRNYYPAESGHEDAQVMALDLRAFGAAAT